MDSEISRLPHKPPMVMIQRILQREEQTLTACAVANRSNTPVPFSSPQDPPSHLPLLLSPWVVLEFLAQAAALHGQSAENSLIKEGRIVAIRSLHLFCDAVREGAEYRVLVALQERVHEYSVYKGALYHMETDEKVAESTFSVLAMSGKPLPHEG